MNNNHNNRGSVIKNTSKKQQFFKCSCCGSTVKYECSSCPNCKKKMTSDDNWGDPIFR